ncbi:hypothetical protein [Streptomyces cylindrosporus]|uniref:Uncharacterized protein n=1 Tax=Streptomyces cylindrosporus TaxID=2927583 RepID=A0ABS9YHW7_9ACTN|nr:hypothetical protein [Streptomyces cylindrosporus]MCI3276780.1 hypothetical protein [Streptomyces cylindrosporus]
MRAAVHRQCKTKDEIVIAAVEEEPARLSAVMDAGVAGAGAGEDGV